MSGYGTKTRRKACESGGACVIADGKFQPSGISGKVTGKGHANTYLPHILVTVYSSRSPSICFKALQLLSSNLVLTAENKEMPRYAA
jgi:hypothetical protein